MWSTMRPVFVSSFTQRSVRGFLTCTRFFTAPWRFPLFVFVAIGWKSSLLSDCKLRRRYVPSSLEVRAAPYCCLTSPTSAVKDAFASPKSMEVAGA